MNKNSAVLNYDKEKTLNNYSIGINAEIWLLFLNP